VTKFSSYVKYLSKIHKPSFCNIFRKVNAVALGERTFEELQESGQSRAGFQIFETTVVSFYI
jgi:hypothetical protein